MICELIQKYCSKRVKIKIKKATEKPEDAMRRFPVSEIPKWFRIAIEEIGIKEHPGENHNPRIIEYHKSCELRAKTDEIAWCSAFVNWCFLKSGVDFRTRSAAAISWSKWGNHVETPKVGDVVVFRRVDSDWRGHVGFFVASNKDSILVLGGNQGNQVSFQWYSKRGTKLHFHQYRSMQ